VISSEFLCFAREALDRIKDAAQYVEDDLDNQNLDHLAESLAVLSGRVSIIQGVLLAKIVYENSRREDTKSIK